VAWVPQTPSAPGHYWLGSEDARGNAKPLTDIMTIAAARALRDHQSCFVGIGVPSTAANLARATSAPNLQLIYESGCIGSKPTRLPLSIGDGELAETADAVVPVLEMFNYWLQGGRIDVGFLGAAQIDRFGNLNSTVIGDYDQPSTRLPGAGGAPEIAASCREVLIIIQHSRRTFVDKVDFVTTVGYGKGYGDRERLGFCGAGPSMVISDLGVLKPDPDTCELVLTAIHPDVEPDDVRAATGWDLHVAADLERTSAPSVSEITALRTLVRTDSGTPS
jgi:glutaconate CoA-transferase, subunit B